MVKEEWKEGVAILKSFYTSQNFLPDALTWNVWLEGLKDIPYEIIKRSIVIYSQTNKFPPTVADLREIALSFVPGEKLNEMQAWALVGKAVRNSMNNAETEFDKLPALVQISVGSPSVLKEWAKMEEDKMSIAQAQFLKSFKANQIREKNLMMLSDGIRNELAIGMTEQKMIASKPEEKQAAKEDYVQAPKELLDELKRKLGAI